MAFAGLWQALRTKVRPWISSGNYRLDTLDQLFEFAAAWEFKPDHNTPGGQQRQMHTGESQKGGDKKRNFRPSICEPAENTSGNFNTSVNCNNSCTGNSKSGTSSKSSGGTRAHLSPWVWLSKEIYKSRKANRQCTHYCSGDHKTYLCTKYGKSNPPEQNPSNNSGNDGKRVKRQKWFDTQQRKNKSTSLDI